MNSKKVTRYYCDFCRKGSLSAAAMRKHEKGCTNNPQRVCGLCATLKNEQRPMDELTAVLAVEKDGYGMKELRELCRNCPACILAAIRQSKIITKTLEQYPYDYVDLQFDFKQELQAFWDAHNDAAYQAANPI